MDSLHSEPISSRSSLSTSESRLYSLIRNELHSEPTSSRSSGSTHEPGLNSLIRNRDIENVRALLTNTIQLQADLDSALILAIEQCNADIVESLIKAGADVQPAGSYIPLQDAARCEDGKIVQHLLDAGAPVDTEDRYHNTPLLTAMRVLTQLAEELRVQKSRGSDQVTLREEEIRRYTEVIKILIESGASVSSTSSSDSVLTLAIKLKDIDILRYIVERADDKKNFVNAFIQRGPSLNFSALYFAVETRQVNLVRYLIEAGADPLLPQGNPGISLLVIHFAIMRGPGSDVFEIIQYLIDVDGSQLEEKMPWGETCLHLAAKANFAQCVDLLLAKGADCMAVNTQRQTPWQVAWDTVNMGRSPRLAAIGAFLNKEVTEKSVDEKYPVHTWFLLSDNKTSRLVDKLDWGGGNLIYAALTTYSSYVAEILSKDYHTILYDINSGFAQHSEPYSALCVREAICTFDTLNDSGRKFMCLAIPYLSSTTIDFLENR
ncbi:ankyrin repeat-containing domain protein [Xylaria palmicola]|nr:ankyrin repeat-containing domain protein [Xylaria palmicola]